MNEPPQSFADSHLAAVRGPDFVSFADPIFRECRNTANTALCDDWKAAVRLLIGPAGFSERPARTILVVPRLQVGDLLLTLLRYIPTRKAIEVDMIEDRSFFAGRVMRLPTEAGTIRITNTGVERPSSDDGDVHLPAAAGRWPLGNPR